MSSRHRFFVSAERIEGAGVRFTAQQARQIATVLRMQSGERVAVFDGSRPADLVVEVSLRAHGEVVGRIVDERPRSAEPGVLVTAYPALLQRDKFEQVVQKLVEVGVSAVVPVVTSRCLVREGPDARRMERWQRIAREAAEQSGRCVVPSIGPAAALTDALRQAAAEAPVLVADGRARGRVSLRTAAEQLGVIHPRTLALFVGPEGGFADEEIDAARACGAVVVSLGPRTLRTETASPVFAALVLYAFSALDGDI